MKTESNRYTYQSRLIYENILSESLKRCLKERIDSPEGAYIRAVKAFSMAMPTKIKKQFDKYCNKDLIVLNEKLQEEYRNKIITKGEKETQTNDAILEYLLTQMESYNLLIPEKTIPRGGGYR